MVAKRSKVLQNAPLGVFRNAFDLHKAIISLEKQFAYDRLYCILTHTSNVKCFMSMILFPEYVKENEVLSTVFLYMSYLFIPVN